MEVVLKTQGNTFQNSQTCSALEYPMKGKEINGAVIELTGRYPDTGCVMNLQCQELAYVIRGSGKLVVEGKEVLLSEGDMALILPNEKYFWEGTMILFIAATPAWRMEQHRQIP